MVFEGDEVVFGEADPVCSEFGVGWITWAEDALAVTVVIWECEDI